MFHLANYRQQEALKAKKDVFLARYLRQQIPRIIEQPRAEYASVFRPRRQFRNAAPEGAKAPAAVSPELSERNACVLGRYVIICRLPRQNGELCHTEPNSAVHGVGDWHRYFPVRAGDQVHGYQEHDSRNRDCDSSHQAFDAGRVGACFREQLHAVLSLDLRADVRLHHDDNHGLHNEVAGDALDAGAVPAAAARSEGDAGGVLLCGRHLRVCSAPRPPVSSGLQAAAENVLGAEQLLRVHGHAGRDAVHPRAHQQNEGGVQRAAAVPEEQQDQGADSGERGRAKKPAADALRQRRRGLLVPRDAFSCDRFVYLVVRPR